jgi:mono/diheme cytochrome c family protein
MAKLLRWTGYVLGVLILLMALTAAYVWIASTRKLGSTIEAKPEKLVVPTAAELADGPRQLKILGCVSCHGEGLRGRMMFEEPKVAQVYAPNLTLVAAQATDQQLAQAIRQGIGHDGHPLMVMPSAQYSRLTDGEVAALISAIRVQPKGGRQTPPIKLGPLGRIGLATGKFQTQPEKVSAYAQSLPADLGPRIARGRHLAVTACSECHGAALNGGEPQPDLKAPGLSMVGAYDLPAFARLLRTGVPSSGKKLTLMEEVAKADFSHLTDKEIAVLHAYLVERAQRAP